MVSLRSVVAIGLAHYVRDVETAIHSAASFVPNAPPMSDVVFFCCTAASTA
jgi:hypothetical protein